MKYSSSEHSPSDLDAIIHDICSILREKQWRMGTAESCTGGGIAKTITDLQGVSDVFAGGIIAYSNDLKIRLLGVSAVTLESYGAVSPETATEMVLGLVKQLELKAGVSVTGIAGPAGGTQLKPVGLVYISTCVDTHCRTSEFYFSSNRLSIRNETTQTALTLLRQHLGFFMK